MSLKKISEKSRSRLLLCLFSIAVIVFWGETGFSQSRDIDNPTPLKSRVLTGDLVGGSSSEYFYSFYAEPGSFTIILDVTTTNYNSTLDVTLVSDTNSGSGFSASATHKGTDRRSKTFNVTKRKKIVMKLKDFSTSDGTFKITLSGTVALPK